MLTIVLAALAVALWVEAGVAQLRAMLAVADNVDRAMWTASDLSPSARAARATIFAVYVAAWPIILLICAALANSSAMGDDQ